MTKADLIRSLLASAGRELYGLEMVRLSRGKLKRGTIYVTLDRMEDEGLIVSRLEKEATRSGTPRRLYRLKRSER